LVMADGPFVLIMKARTRAFIITSFYIQNSCTSQSIFSHKNVALDLGHCFCFDVNALIYPELKMPICFNFDKKKLNKIG